MTLAVPKYGERIESNGVTSAHWYRFFRDLLSLVTFQAPSVETVTTTAHTASTVSAILVDDDAAGGAVTVTLPLSASTTSAYHIKKLGSTGSVTVAAQGSDTIDDGASIVIEKQYKCVSVVPDNSTGWWVI